MRLLILSTEFPPGPGGIGTHAHQLARQLVRLGWQITVISRQDYVSAQEAAQFNAQQPFKIIRLRPYPTAPLDAAYRWWLTAHTLRQQRPDLILATGERALWIAALWPRRVPVVAVGHGSEFGLDRAWELFLTRRAFQRASFVICVSQFTWNYMLGKGITPRDGVVIPNGADAEQFRALPDAETRAFRESQGLAGCHVLLTVGQVNERKGQHVVIRALPHILKHFPNTQYLMAGLPTDREPLLALARELQVSDHIRFLGRVEAHMLPHYVNACDVFVMTSCHTQRGDFEGYGIAAVEAALCGKPAVVSDNSGLPEAVIHGETGMVVPQNAPEQTAEAIVALLSDEARRTRMGRAAQQRAWAEQTWEKRAALYHAQFKKLIGR